MLTKELSDIHITFMWLSLRKELSLLHCYIPVFNTVSGSGGI